MSGAPLHAHVRFWRDPALPGVEARSSTYTRNAFRTHTHRACIISLVEAGSTTFSLEHTRHTARAGHMVVIEAGRPHACNPEAGSGLSYRLLALDMAWLTGAFGGGAPRFPSPVLDDPELFAAWGELHQAFVGGAPTGRKQALLLTCLHGLVSRHADADPADAITPAAAPVPATASVATHAHTQNSSAYAQDGSAHTQNSSAYVQDGCAHALDGCAVMRARRRIEASAGQWVPLGELAELAGLSPQHFSRVFKAATGLPPHRYQLQQAVERAKTLLCGGASICQAALEAGFADQSHFSRRFREFTGATPRQYLANPPAPQNAPQAGDCRQAQPQIADQPA